MRRGISKQFWTKYPWNWGTDRLNLIKEGYSPDDGLRQRFCCSPDGWNDTPKVRWHPESTSKTNSAS